MIQLDPNRVFTAERKLRQIEGYAMSTVGALPSQSERTILAAIEALRRDIAEQFVPGGAAGAEVNSLRDELRNLHECITRTKAEIGALRRSTKGGDRLSEVNDELGAIVEATEAATNTILDAAEKIDGRAQTLRAAAPDQATVTVAEEMGEQVIRIFESCNFQDLTGQRINKVCKALQFIDERINAMMHIFGDKTIVAAVAPAEIESPAGDEALLNGPQLPGNAISQSDIDKLFG